MNDVITSDNPLSAEDRDLLESLAGSMIPACAEYAVPGADDELIFAEIMRMSAPHALQIVECVQTLDAFAREHYGNVFPALAPDERAKLLEEFRRVHFRVMRRIISIVVQCYYHDERVMASLGMEPRAPFPKGFDVDQGDWSLLDVVKQRPALYRAV